MLGMVPISQAAHRALAPPAETVLPVQGVQVPLSTPWPAGQLGAAFSERISMLRHHVAQSAASGLGGWGGAVVQAAAPTPPHPRAGLVAAGEVLGGRPQLPRTRGLMDGSSSLKQGHHGDQSPE